MRLEGYQFYVLIENEKQFLQHASIILSLSIKGIQPTKEYERLEILYDFIWPPKEDKIDIFANDGSASKGIFKPEIVKFTDCHFRKKVHVKFLHEEMSFENCHFYENLKFQFIEKDVTINKGSTIKSLDLSNADFGLVKQSTNEGKFRLHECVVELASFYNTTFNSLADFWNTTFKKPTTFFKTDFNSTAVFSMATFEENVLFTYSLLAGKSIFAKTEFKKGLDLSQAIISGDLKLFDIQFENDEFQTQFFKKLQKSEYQNSIDYLGIIPTENKVHTFQILRKAYEDVGNYDDATKMRRAEKVALRELTQEKKRDSQHTSSTLGDRLILWLNRWSNNFRSDFRNGLTFTGVTAVLFASITLLLTESFYNNICWGCDFDFETFSDGIAFIFRFLNPTHRIDYLDPLNPFLGIAYLFDFLGRIFVGYGIYQTI